MWFIVGFALGVYREKVKALLFMAVAKITGYTGPQ